ncbi:MAG: hypothetical protein AXA67_07655 [Methylothermaceae bacteria B42]|nr:MAG: hypothetical protein AXA67_07655 [Methylothermaceae bacteria B42]HHJ40101.1 TlpA family protein disulfide reductase [Methylothermaceae bacterium]
MKNKWIVVLAALVALLGGVATSFWLNAPKNPPPSLPTMQIPDLHGKSHQLTEWQGKVLVVNFWATWCAPCRQEIPDLNRWQQQYGGHGLQIIGIAVDNPGSVTKFIQDVPMDYPILVAEKTGLSLATLMGNILGVLPYSAIFDRSGKLVFGHAGILDADTFNKRVKILLN